jgi:hypothetical protein
MAPFHTKEKEQLTSQTKQVDIVFALVKIRELSISP